MSEPDYFCYCRKPLPVIKRSKIGDYKICKICGGLIY